MSAHVACLTITMLCLGCGPKQKPVETEPVKEEPATEEVEPEPEEEAPPKPKTEEEQAEIARGQVVTFLDSVRAEKYEQAYEDCSWVLKKVYTYDQFLMIAGKLEMEELPCITIKDIEAMEQTTGHVGIGPKDIEVAGFLIRYECGGEKRILFIYLDWGGQWDPPGGVASVWWRAAPPE